MTEEELAAQEAQHRRLYKRVFGTEDGRKVLRHLTATHDLNGPCFGGDFNPYRAAQRDGEKNVLTHILRMSAPNPNTDDD